MNYVKDFLLTDSNILTCIANKNIICVFTIEIIYNIN